MVWCVSTNLSCYTVSVFRKMNPGGFENDERGVSEIYGTVLIISMALVTALVLVGVGMVTMQEITSDTSDDMAREALLELNSRIEEVTDSAVDTRATMVFPEGTGTDVEARPDEGKVNITVTTEDDYWHESANAGDFVDAKNQTDNATIKLGTIVHEDNDGVQTVLQGGGVWRKEDGSISMLASPSMNLDDDSLQLSFVNLSSINLVQEGEELTIRKNTTSSRQTSNRLQEMIREHMTHDGQVVAEANVTITIESQYASGWKNYAEDMDGVDSSDVKMVDDNTVTIHFGTYGQGIANVPGPDFDDDIIYTGLSDFAPALYNDTEGTLENISSAPGYKVVDPDDPGGNSVDGYRVGILYDHYDDGRDWWVWNDGAGKWENIENASTPQINPGAPETVETVNIVGDDQFEIADRTWTCAVNVSSGKEFRDYVPNDTEAKNGNTYGCLHGPKGVENPDEHGAEFESRIEINDFRTTVVWESNGSEVSPQPTDVVIGEQEVTINVSLSNTGTGNGSTPFAVLVGNQSTNWDTNDDDPDIRDGQTGLQLDRGDSTWFNTSLAPTKQVLEIYNAGNNGAFEIGAGTQDDAVSEPNRGEYTAIWTNSAANFSIESIDSVTPTPPNSIEEGTGTVTVDATVKNQGNQEATGVVRFLVGSDELVDYERKESVPAGATKTVTLEWDLGNNAAAKNDTAKLKTDEEEQGVDVWVTDAATDNSNFQIVDNENDIWNNSAVNEGEYLNVTANVTNKGSDEATKMVALKNATTQNILAWNETTLSAGEHMNVTFNWSTSSSDVGEYDLLVDTTDDTEDFPIEIDATTTSTEYRITEMRANSSVDVGETVEVAVNVTNYGDAGSKNVWLEDFTGEPVDINTNLNLASGESAEFNFTWKTDGNDAGTGDITANSSSDYNSTSVEVIDPNTGDSNFDVSIDGTNSSVVEGQNLTVDVTVTNTGADSDTQTIALENYNGTAVDVADVSLSGGGDSQNLNLSWRTIVGDKGEGYVNVSTEDDGESVKVEITPKPNETRNPADVAFVLDETGSMGPPDRDGVEYDTVSNPSGTAVVPDGEVWETCTEITLWWCSGEERYWTPGVEVNLDNYEYLSKYNSISGNDPYGKRINATLTAIGSLDQTFGDRAGLVEFNDYASTYQPVTNSFDVVNDSLQIFPDGYGWTNITDALLQGEEALEDPGSSNDKYMILLTDGEHTGAGNITTTNPEDIAENISSDVTIYTVGFGNANNQTLKNISQDGGSGDGEYFYSSNADNLASVFETIINKTTEPDTPDFIVENTISDTYVDEGDNFVVEADINNTGEAPGTQVTTLVDHKGRYVDSWSANLSVNEQGTAVFEWDTTGAVNWSQVAGDSVTKQISVQTPTDNETVSVTINKTEPEILAGDIYTNATDSDGQSIAEGDTMWVNVTLDNTGGITAETGVWLYNDSSNELLAGTSGIEVSNGQSKNVTLHWDTEIGDADITQVNATTDYDPSWTDSQPVNITDVGTASSSEFGLNITSTNASTANGNSIEEGQKLNVEVNATNIGSQSDSTSLMLWDVGNNTIVDIVQVPETDPGNNATVDLTWNTSDGDGDTTGLITVETWNREDNDTEEVEITKQGAPNVNYRIDSISTTNADDPNNPLPEGDTMTVEVEIKNVGETPNEPQPIVLTDGNDNIGNITEATIAGGDTETVTILWKNVPLINEIKVENASGMQKQHTVHIESSANTPDIDVSIKNLVNPSPFPDTRDKAVVAGDEDVDVEVEVENNGGEDENVFIALYAEFNGQEKLVAVEDTTVSKNGGTVDPTLTWETEPRQGSDNDNWQLWAEVRSTQTSKTDVYLDLPAGLRPGGPAFGGGDSGVDVEVGDIEVG